MKIYGVTHKKVNLDELKLSSCYSLIRVGEFAKEDSEEIADNTGMNISDKNPNYCELTAQYWIWKNDTYSDIVGLCHYRRYFTKHSLSTNPKYIISERDIRSILSKYDAIVSPNESYCCGAYQKYLFCGYEKDLQTTKKAIEMISPEYLPYYESEFENSAGFRLGNMIITSKENFDLYCEWLFEILAYVEKNTDLSSYTVQEARIYGYLSERLLNVWLVANKKRCKSMRIINTEEKHHVIYYIKEFLKMMKIYNVVKKMIFNISRIVKKGVSK